MLLTKAEIARADGLPVLGELAAEVMGAPTGRLKLLAFAVGAVPEVLGPIDSSLTVAPRDTAAMIARVQRFLALSPSDRAERGRWYREQVLERYSLAAAAATLQSLYTKLRKNAS